MKYILSCPRCGSINLTKHDEDRECLEDESYFVCNECKFEVTFNDVNIIEIESD